MQPRRFALIGHHHSIFDLDATDPGANSLIGWDDTAGSLDYVNDLDFTLTGDWTWAAGTHIHLGTEEVMVVNGATVHGQLEINSDTAAIEEIHTHSASNNSVLYFARSRGSDAAPTVVAADDYLGALYAVGFDGTDYALSAGIQFAVDGTPGSNDMPGRIVFAVSPDGSQSLAEALRITSAKHVDMRNDSAELRIGAGNDLRIYHDGTDSFIQNDTGKLILPIGGTGARQVQIRGDQTTVGAYQFILEGERGGYGAGISFQSELNASPFTLTEMARITAEGENSWNATASTQDAYLSFRTTVDGTSVEQVRIRSSGFLALLKDNQELTIGAGNDLRLYHDGTDSFIDNDGRTAIKFLSGGSMLLAPTAGNIALVRDNQELRFGVGDDLRIYHDGSNNIIRNDTGTLNFLFGTTKRILFGNAGGAGASTYIELSDSTPTAKAYVGIADANNDVITGTLPGDLFVRSQSERIVFSIDGGTTMNAAIAGSATATHTHLLIYDVDNATLERVSVGAADSGGAGFKVLRIPN